MNLSTPSPTPCFDQNFVKSLNCYTASWVFLQIVGIIGAILCCCAFIACCHSKCVDKRIKNFCGLFCLTVDPNDDTQPVKLVYFAFSWMDYMSDWAWAIWVYSQQVDSIWKIVAGLGVVVPYAINLIWAIFYTIRIKKNSNYAQSDQWVKLYSWFYMIAVIFTGNGEPVLQLFNSRICNLSMFSMNLRRKLLYYQAKKYRVILNCLCEKAPQLAIQIWFSEAYPTVYGGVTVIAALFSGIGLFVTLMQAIYLCCLRNQFRKERIELTFIFDDNSNSNGGAPLCPPVMTNNNSTASTYTLNSINKNNNNNMSRSGATKTLSSDTQYHKIIDQVFGLTKRITQYAAKNFNFGKKSLVCQFVEKNFSEDDVKMMVEVLTDDEYKQNKLTDNYLNEKLARSDILINGINGLISEIYIYEFGSQQVSPCPVKVHLIKARVVSGNDWVHSPARDLGVYLSKDGDNINDSNNNGSPVTGARDISSMVDPVEIGYQGTEDISEIKLPETTRMMNMSSSGSVALNPINEKDKDSPGWSPSTQSMATPMTTTMTPTHRPSGAVRQDTLPAVNIAPNTSFFANKNGNGNENDTPRIPENDPYLPPGSTQITPQISSQMSLQVQIQAQGPGKSGLMAVPSQSSRKSFESSGSMFGFNRDNITGDPNVNNNCDENLHDNSKNENTIANQNENIIEAEFLDVPMREELTMGNASISSDAASAPTPASSPDLKKSSDQPSYDGALQLVENQRSNQNDSKKKNNNNGANNGNILANINKNGVARRNLDDACETISTASNVGFFGCVVDIDG